jgi:hypothetical protein
MFKGLGRPIYLGSSAVVKYFTPCLANVWSFTACVFTCALAASSYNFLGTTVVATTSCEQLYLK